MKPALKTLKDADAEIAKADQQIQTKNFPVAYFLTKDLLKNLDSVTPDDPATYNGHLASATDKVFVAANEEQAAI